MEIYFKCNDCGEVHSEEELVDYMYRHSSNHYVEDDIRCTCGSTNLFEVDAPVAEEDE